MAMQYISESEEGTTVSVRSTFGRMQARRQEKPRSERRNFRYRRRVQSSMESADER